MTKGKWSVNWAQATQPGRGVVLGLWIALGISGATTTLFAVFGVSAVVLLLPCDSPPGILAGWWAAHPDVLRRSRVFVHAAWVWLGPDGGGGRG